ncbi:MAG: DUF1674 domain-containing protein [Alphaproteobacteria bacterium]|nr:DUF1674 domain-containing protein [Alphaproteobacteria bacterium]
MSNERNQSVEGRPETTETADQDRASDKEAPKEVGGRKGPEPTRYGDWEKNGIISDF